MLKIFLTDGTCDGFRIGEYTHWVLDKDNLFFVKNGEEVLALYKFEYIFKVLLDEKDEYEGGSENG